MVFEYAGPVDRNKLDELVEIAEARSLAVRDGVSIRKRLFNVLVEGLENIHRHTPIEFADSGFALLERRDGHYRVVIGNTLPAASAAIRAHGHCRGSEGHRHVQAGRRVCFTES